jgi:hypothetical protein
MCVNVLCTNATVCQPSCGWQTYHIRSGFFKITAFETGRENGSLSVYHQSYSHSLALFWPSIQNTNFNDYSFNDHSPNFPIEYFFGRLPSLLSSFFWYEQHEMKTNMDLGGIILAELNRRSWINFYFCGSTKPRWTRLDSNPVLRCERLAGLRLSHGRNGTEVLERNPVISITLSSTIRWWTDLQSNAGLLSKGKKGKAVPLQAWSGPEGSRKLRFPDYMTTAQDVGKVVSLTHRPPLSPGNATGTHFCQRLSRSQGHSAIGRNMSMKNSNETIWYRTSDLPICSAVPWPLCHHQRSTCL